MNPILAVTQLGPLSKRMVKTIRVKSGKELKKRQCLYRGITQVNDRVDQKMSPRDREQVREN